MARPTGFEPVTSAFGGQHSIQLSYGREASDLTDRGKRGNGRATGLSANRAGKLHKAPSERAFRIGERIDDGVMVGAGDRHVAGSDTLAAPILGDGPARTQELAALLPADPCVEDGGARRQVPGGSG